MRFGDRTQTIGWIVLLAAAVRLAYVLAYPQVPLESEAEGYDVVSRRFVAGQGFPAWDPSTQEISKPPLYILFVSGIYAAVGSQPQAVRITQAMAGALIPALAYWLSLLAGLARRQAAWAALLCALLPSLVIYTGGLYVETLLTFCASSALSGPVFVRNIDSK